MSNTACNYMTNQNKPFSCENGLHRSVAAFSSVSKWTQPSASQGHT